MSVPSRMALAAFAAGLGVLLAGAPALAQPIPAPAEDGGLLGAPPADPRDADAPPALPADPTTIDAPPLDAQPDTPPLDSQSAAPRSAEPGAEDGPPIATQPPEPAAAGAAQDVAGSTTVETAPSVDGAQADTAAQAPEQSQAQAEQPGIAGQMSHWIVSSGDNNRLPFVIVDKVAAETFVFDADGQLLGVAPVLVGLALGDDSADGVGDLALADVRPDERTTPAGRFITSFGPASGNHTVLWVDYAAAISLHPVVTHNAKERRLQRMQSPDPQDHRITYGCINVPIGFYQQVVLKAFAGGSGVVYVLPDTKPLSEVFPTFAAQMRTSLPDGGLAAPNLADAGAQSTPASATAPLAQGDAAPGEASQGDASEGATPQANASQSDPSQGDAQQPAAADAGADRRAAAPVDRGGTGAAPTRRSAD